MTEIWDTLREEFKKAIDNVLRPINVRNALIGAERIKEFVDLSSRRDFALGYLLGFLWGSFEFFVFYNYSRTLTEEEREGLRHILRQRILDFRDAIHKMS